LSTEELLGEFLYKIVSVLVESDFIHLCYFFLNQLLCAVLFVFVLKIWFPNFTANNNCKLNSNKLTDERKDVEGPGEKEGVAQTYRLAPD
jgi:hypothetical protein